MNSGDGEFNVFEEGGRATFQRPSSERREHIMGSEGTNP
jgi:hypothetical protein